MNKTELQSALTKAGVEFENDATKKTLQALLNNVEVGETEDEPKVGASIVPNKYKTIYGKSGNCGDDLASVLTAATTDEKGKTTPSKLVEIMSENGLDTSRWENLNIGQRRMNLGNVLRSRLKRGEHVSIAGTEWNTEAVEAVA